MMIVQVYKNDEKNDFVIINKSHLKDKKLLIGYNLIDEIEGVDWDDCGKRISEKYFNLKSG